MLSAIPPHGTAGVVTRNAVDLASSSHTDRVVPLRTALLAGAALLGTRGCQALPLRAARGRRGFRTLRRKLAVRRAAAVAAVQTDADRLLVRFFHKHIDAGVWKQIEQTLQQLAERCELGAIVDAEDLTDELVQIRKMTRYQTDLRAFTKSLQRLEAAGICELKTFLGPVFAWALRLALSLPELFSEGLPLLRQRQDGEVLLTRRQCAALLVASLLGVIPDYQGQCQHNRPHMPGFDMSYLMKEEGEKMLCLFSYLQQISTADEGFLDEVVSFSRRAQDEEQVTEAFWANLEVPLMEAQVAEGLIECSAGNLQADFANYRLGGGALHCGKVQEEIRFITCPECIVGMLLCEPMLENETIFIVGAQQYSSYRGYGDSFRFATPAKPATERDAASKPDSLGRRGPHLVAMDALQHPGDWQYEKDGILRELLKAYTAALGDLSESAGQRQKGFATGNWGCGVFGGDPQLKALIQWLAASAAGRELVYFPFGDDRMRDLDKVIQALRSRKATVAELYALLQDRQPGAVFSEVLAELGC